MSEMIKSFFLAESESEYYSSIRKFSNPNPNIIRDFKKDSNIFESLKRFEYSKIIRIIQLFLNKIWKIKSRKQELRKHIQKAPKGIKWQSHPSTGLVHWCPKMGSAGRLHHGESVTQTQILKIRYFWNFIFCHLNIVRV